MAARNSREPGGNTKQHVQLSGCTVTVSVIPKHSSAVAQAAKKKSSSKKKSKSKQPPNPPTHDQPPKPQRKPKGGKHPKEGTVMEELRLEAGSDWVDPREKSSFLGHVVDNTVGAVADALDKIPLVGAPLGAVGRAAQTAVRGAEDAVNSVAFGIPFFIIALVFLPSCVADSSHDCLVNGTWKLSNACDPSEIYFTDGNMVVHAAGCVPCRSGNCSVPWFMTVSYFDPSKADLIMCKWVDWIALGTYACEVTAMGEVCSLLIGVAEVVHRHWYVPQEFQCDCECAMNVAPGNQHSVFFQALADRFSTIGDIFHYLFTVPIGLFRLIVTGYPLVTALIILYLAAGRYLSVLVLVMMVGYCVEGGLQDRSKHHLVELPLFNIECANPSNFVPSAIAIPGMSGLWYMDKFGQLWNASESHVPYNVSSVGVGRGAIEYHNQSCRFWDCTGGIYFEEDISSDHCIICMRHRVMVHTPARNYTFHGHDSMVCGIYNSSVGKELSSWCVVDYRPPLCRQHFCFADCSTRHPSLRYDLCGVSYVVNQHINFTIGQGYGKLLMGLNRELVDYNCSSKTPASFPLRMPGYPLITSGSSRVCPGYAWPTGAVGSGFIILQNDTQYFFASRILYHMNWASHVMIMVVFLTLTGARIVPVLWAIITLHLVEALPCVTAAVNPGIGLGVAVAQLVRWGDVLAWVYALIITLLASSDRTILPLLALVKTVLGYPALALAGYWLTLQLPNHSVSGTEVDICLSVSDEWLWWFSANADWCMFVFYIFTICYLFSFTYPGRNLKLRILFFVKYFHFRIRTKYDRSLIGCNKYRGFSYELMGVTFLLAMIDPITVTVVLAFFYASCVALDLILVGVIAHSKVQFRLDGMIALCDIIAESCNRISAMLCFRLAYRLKLPLVFSHLGHLSKSCSKRLTKIGLTLNPVGWPSAVETVIEAGADYACGDYVRGKPVFARFKDTFYLGNVFKPPIVNGMRLNWSAPLTVSVTKRTSLPQALAYGVIGRDYQSHTGSIVALKNGGQGFMGFVLGAHLVTVNHGCKSKSLATPYGPAPPVASPSDDICLYSAPGGMTPLQTCNCTCSKAVMFNKDGHIMKLIRDGATWAPELLKPLCWYKGSSGTPILCSEGHVIEMFRGVTVKNGGAVKVHGVAVDPAKFNFSQATRHVMNSYPLVPDHQEICSYVAPTGSGKSTKLPMYYVSKGYKTLVLSPSVAATKNLVKYMADAHQLRADLHAGDVDITVGSLLTYSTYGKMLANTNLLMNYDVVLCDECHAVDATTILGIGTVLTKAPSLKAKLICLMTATPPGCSLTPHTNITEIQLTDEGEVDFFGKKLKLENYKRGRHVIFCGSKANCHKISDSLSQKGIKTHVYYRGLNPDDIPDGDVVVCCTDALLTGYNGDFDSCTDCCVELTEAVNVDLAPTLTTYIRTSISSTAVRMQRRGRTGRGRPGVYYYTSSATGSSAVIEDGAIVEAFDTGISWYRFKAENIATILEEYNRETLTPNIVANVNEFVAFFKELEPMALLPEVFKAKEAGYSFALLTGVQAHLCLEAKAPAPSKHPRWSVYRFTGNNPIPLLVNLDDRTTHPTVGHEIVDKCCAALGYSVSCSLYIVLGAGLAIIGFVQLIDSVSSVVIVKDFKLSNASGKQITYNDYWQDLLEECAGNADWISSVCHNMQGYCAKAVSAFRTVLVAETTNQKVMRMLNTHIMDLGGFATMVMSFFVGKHNPVLTGILSGTGAYLSSAPLWFKFTTALFGASVLSIQGGLLSSTAALFGSIGGALMKETQILQSFLSMFFTTNSGLAMADIVYSLLCGELPPTYRFVDFFTCLAAPGGAVLGVMFAFMLKSMGNKSVVDWTNRLLSMNSKNGPICDNFFIAQLQDEKKILNLLHKFSFTRVVMTLSHWESVKTYDCANSIFSQDDFTSWCQSLVWWLINWLRVKFEWVSRFTQINIPGIGCSIPMKIEFEGSGMIRSTCECGSNISYSLKDGKTEKFASSWLCLNAWRDGVILTRDTEMIDIKITIPDGPRVLRYGIKDYIEINSHHGRITLTKTTTLNIDKQRALWCAGTVPVAINGCNWFADRVKGFIEGGSIMLDGKRQELPVVLSTPSYTAKYVPGTKPVVVLSTDTVDVLDIMSYLNLSHTYSCKAHVSVPTALDADGRVDVNNLEMKCLFDYIAKIVLDADVVICATKYTEKTLRAILSVLHEVTEPLAELKDINPFHLKDICAADFEDIFGKKPRYTKETGVLIVDYGTDPLPNAIMGIPVHLRFANAAAFWEMLCVATSNHIVLGKDDAHKASSQVSVPKSLTFLNPPTVPVYSEAIEMDSFSPDYITHLDSASNVGPSHPPAATAGITHADAVDGEKAEVSVSGKCELEEIPLDPPPAAKPVSGPGEKEIVSWKSLPKVLKKDPSKLVADKGIELGNLVQKPQPPPRTHLTYDNPAFEHDHPHLRRRRGPTAAEVEAAVPKIAEYFREMDKKLGIIQHGDVSIQVTRSEVSSVAPVKKQKKKRKSSSVCSAPTLETQMEELVTFSDPARCDDHRKETSFVEPTEVLPPPELHRPITTQCFDNPVFSADEVEVAKTPVQHRKIDIAPEITHADAASSLCVSVDKPSHGKRDRTGHQCQMEYELGGADFSDVNSNLSLLSTSKLCARCPQCQSEKAQTVPGSSESHIDGAVPAKVPAVVELAAPTPPRRRKNDKTGHKCLEWYEDGCLDPEFEIEWPDCFVPKCPQCNPFSEEFSSTVTQTTTTQSSTNTEEWAEAIELMLHLLGVPDEVPQQLPEQLTEVIVCDQRAGRIDPVTAITVSVDVHSTETGENPGLNPAAKEFVPRNSVPETNAVKSAPRATRSNGSVVSSEEEISWHSCSASYYFNGNPIAVGLGKKKAPISLFGVLMGSKRNNVYYTNPENVYRVIERNPPEYPPAYMKLWHAACKAVSNIKAKYLSLSEVGVLTSARTARSTVSGITGADVKAGNSKAIKAIEAARDHFRTGSGSAKLSSVTLAPKVEIFGLMNNTPKPARYICYPPLETRCWEKIVFGDVAPRVVERVLGSAYGPNYTPHEKGQFLVRAWLKRRNPVGFACDAVKFDSQITPEDVEKELGIYQSVDTTEEHRNDMASISRRLYAGSPMYNQKGMLIGYRECRASGVYTTSSSNHLTAYLKLKSACDIVGIQDPTLLVNGDDCTGIFESTADDEGLLRNLAIALERMNFRTKPIEPCYSLEDMETCSSNVTIGKTWDDRTVYMLTRNPLNPMARAMCETTDSNPLGRWVGNIIMFAPTLWARWLSVGWLDFLTRNPDGPPTIEAEILGNTVTLRPDQVVPVILAMCGKDAFNIRSYSFKEQARVTQVVQHLGYQPHRLLVRRAVRLRVRILRSFPQYRCLLPLLNFCVPRAHASVAGIKPMPLKFSSYYSSEVHDVSGTNVVRPWYFLSIIPILLIGVLLAV
ncbi:polyprotein [Bald eagle hepacivirus]|nr:polyprotein [Bald eagle hepacivirus]